MGHIIKACALFVFGLAFCRSVSGKMEGCSMASARKRPAAAPMSSAAPRTPAVKSRNDKAETERRQPAPPKIVPQGSYAETCARFDVVNRPGTDIIGVLEYASSVTRTPVDVLYAVWQKETGHLHGQGRMSGGCDLKNELARRDKAAGTAHWQSMLAMADAFGWKAQYGDTLERMTCSCAKTLANGSKQGYGGCCGPFQFSGQEIAQKYAIPHQLDPMTFCGGALIAGWELKRHFDNAFKPNKHWGEKGRGGAIMATNTDYSEEEAGWRAAMSRYYGADPDGRYGRTAVANWQRFHEWYRQDQKNPGHLVSMILKTGNTRASLRILRARQ